MGQLKTPLVAGTERNEEAIELLREVADEYNLWDHPHTSLGVILSHGDQLRQQADKADHRDALNRKVRTFLKATHGG